MKLSTLTGIKISILNLQDASIKLRFQEKQNYRV